MQTPTSIEDKLSVSSSTATNGYGNKTGDVIVCDGGEYTIQDQWVTSTPHDNHDKAVADAAAGSMYETPWTKSVERTNEKQFEGTVKGIGINMDEVEDGPTLDTPAGESVNMFEFSLLFWAPSRMRMQEEEQRRNNREEMIARELIMKSASRGRTRGAAMTTRGGGSPVPEPQHEEIMRWVLRPNNLWSKTSYPFNEIKVLPGELERVASLGKKLEISAKVAGVYEVELGPNVMDGVYVPSLMAAGRANNKTHGPFVGLHRLEDLTKDIVTWAMDMGWYWNDNPNEPAGDPHGLLREPHLDTMTKLEVDDENSRTGIRISSISGFIGPDKEGSILPYAARNSKQTAACTYTAEVGQTPRVEDGELVVYIFRVKLPEGHKKIFSDGTCVVCMSEDSCFSNAACGHVSLCLHCYNRCRDDPCPLCRSTDPGVVV